MEGELNFYLFRTFTISFYGVEYEYVLSNPFDNPNSAVMVRIDSMWPDRMLQLQVKSVSSF